MESRFIRIHRLVVAFFLSEDIAQAAQGICFEERLGCPPGDGNRVTKGCSGVAVSAAVFIEDALHKCDIPEKLRVAQLGNPFGSAETQLSFLSLLCEFLGQALDHLPSNRDVRACK